MDRKLMDFAKGAEKPQESGQFKKDWVIFQVKMNLAFHARVKRRAQQEGIGSIQALVISALEERMKQEIRD